MNLHAILEKLEQLPPHIKAKILPLMEVSVPQADPAGAVLVGVFLARTLGIGKVIDDILGEEHLTIEQMREEVATKGSPKVSTGLVCEILIGDMIGRHEDLTRIYQLEEACDTWRIKDILGVPPEKLNDDRVGRALDVVGATPEVMPGALHAIALNCVKSFGMPLNRFYHDPTAIPVSGMMEDNQKFQYGHGGLPGRKQLMLNMTIAAGASLPVTAAIDPGNVQGGEVFSRTLEQVRQLVQSEEHEIIMDRGIVTKENIHLMLKNPGTYFIGPMKDDLCRSWVMEQLTRLGDAAFSPVDYRSKQEIKQDRPAHYLATETEYTFQVEVNPRKKGELRRKKGTREFVNVTVRAVIYRDTDKQKRDAKHRQEAIEKVETALQELQGKLNKRNLKTKEACRQKVQEIFKGEPDMRQVYTVMVDTNQYGAVTLTWEKNEDANQALAKTDGIFVLLTNHPGEKVGAADLLTRYRGRNDIEMSFRFLKGALDLNQIFLRKDDRVDAYCFLKVIGMFVINFAAWYLHKYGKIKLSPKKLQKEFGNTTMVEQRLQPFGIRRWIGTNITSSIETLVDLLQLPHPRILIDLLNVPLDYGQIIDEWVKKYVVST
ncbi:MAG: IS1634 family transposase [Armatimonadota bacterium]